MQIGMNHHGFGGILSSGCKRSGLRSQSSASTFTREVEELQLHVPSEFSDSQAAETLALLKYSHASEPCNDLQATTAPNCSRTASTDESSAGTIESDDDWVGEYNTASVGEKRKRSNAEKRVESEVHDYRDDTVLPSRRSSPNKWTTEESEKLEMLVTKYSGMGKKKWTTIAKFIPGKKASQCSQRWYRVMDPTLRKGKWTCEEEELLVNLVQHEGAHWKEIARKSDIQCRYYYTKLLASNEVRIDYRFDLQAPWTKEEQELLVKKVHALGSNWSDVAQGFTNTWRWESLVRQGKAVLPRMLKSRENIPLRTESRAKRTRIRNT